MSHASSAYGIPHVGSPIATYTIVMPDGGLRGLDQFDAAEKARLRPIAEVLAMLDGNSFFGITSDKNGDDTHYEQYLPEAAALVATTSGCENASFMRGGTPLFPHPVPEPQTITMVEGQAIVVLTDAGEKQLFEISEIEWDTEDEDIGLSSDEKAPEAPSPLSPELPTSLIVAVEANVDDLEIDFIDRVSDHFGFCIRSLVYRPVVLANSTDRDPADRVAPDHTTPHETANGPFTIIVTRDTTESCVLTIEAINEDEAREAAISKAQLPGVVWESDDTPCASKELYITHVEVVF